MQTQDIIEVRYGSTYTFTYFKEQNNTIITPSTAKISIYDLDGTLIVNEASMTITSGVCTYVWNSSGYEVGMNYKVMYTISGYNPVVRLFDIVKYPFINDVTDDDLFIEYEALRSNMFEDSSLSQSGTTTTLVDLNRTEANDHWNGGSIEIYQGQLVYQRKVTDFVLSTNTVTFTPALPSAVTTNSYTIRQSYQDDINNAARKLQLHFRSLEKRAYLVIDNYMLKDLIVFEVLKKYFFGNIKQDGDEYSIKYKHYAAMYNSTLESLKLVYDENNDGEILVIQSVR
jgi:hypothetical protein